MNLQLLLKEVIEGRKSCQNRNIKHYSEFRFQFEKCNKKQLALNLHTDLKKTNVITIETVNSYV